MAHTHRNAHAQKHRSWLSQRVYLEVRLLLYHGCHSVDIAGRTGRVAAYTAAAEAADSTAKAKKLAVGSVDDTHKHSHTQAHTSRSTVHGCPIGKKLKARLLLRRDCVKVYSV